MGREVHQQVEVIGFRVELAQVRAHVPHDLLHAFRVGRGGGLVPVFGHENQVARRMKTRFLSVRMSVD